MKKEIYVCDFCGKEIEGWEEYKNQFYTKIKDDLTIIKEEGNVKIRGKNLKLSITLANEPGLNLAHDLCKDCFNEIISDILTSELAGIIKKIN
jgi:hypothetical protein